MTPKQIKALRKKLGITQQGLADIVGVGRRQANQWENGAGVSGAALTFLLLLNGDKMRHNDFWIKISIEGVS